jgi:GNAT superfamily N-acetyltransferase
MLIELSPGQRPQLRPLFVGFPGLHGCLHAALEGTMGRAWADDATNPSVARVHLDFDCFAGDANSPAAEELVRSLDPLPSYLIVSNDGWPPLLRRVWGDKLGEHGRVAFQPGAWDHDRLRGFIGALPAAFALRRIGLGDAARFTALADSLTYNFASLEDYIERGVGYGIEHEGRFVSGCSSFAISSYSLEFEIQTHPDFRQRDLASATAAAMILHCIDNNLEPCWDAHNEISAALATKLGFINPKPYTSYELRA